MTLDQLVERMASGRGPAAWGTDPEPSRWRRGPPEPPVCVSDLDAAARELRQRGLPVGTGTSARLSVATAVVRGDLDALRQLPPMVSEDGEMLGAAIVYLDRG